MLRLRRPFAALVALAAALCRAGARGESVGGTGEPDLSCLRPSMTAVPASGLVADAVATVRRAGHDPADYRLELRAAARDGETDLVFLPRDGLHYAVTVSSADPCVVRWLWQPERFTAWQVAVLERARELWIRSVAAEDAQLEDVSVFEAETTVTVELRHTSRAEPGVEVAASRLTLLKEEVQPRAGAAGGGS